MFRRGPPLAKMTTIFLVPIGTEPEPRRRVEVSKFGGKDEKRGRGRGECLVDLDRSLSGSYAVLKIL